MTETTAANIDVKVSGAGMKIRACDQTLVDDLRAKGFPEDEIAGIMAHRQAADADAEDQPPTSD